MNDQPRRTGKSKEEIAQAYVSEPWWYDVRGFFILTFAYNSTLFEQLRFFGRNFGARHLELACGTGTLLELMLRWRRWKRLPAVHVVGVDYAESMLAGAMRRFAGYSNVELQHGDAAALPFPDDYFETVNIANAVHCFPEVDAAFLDIFRVLKPAGILAANVLLTPRGPWPLRPIAERINRWGIRKGILYKVYEQQDIRNRLTTAGFAIDTEVVSGNCLNISAHKP